jgi:integrase
MPTRYLTDSEIRSISNPSKRIEIYDDHKIKDGKLVKSGAKGLALRITPTGVKSFVFRYWYNSKAKRYTIGTFPEWSLSEAREKVRELSKLVSEGTDPGEIRKQNQTRKDYILNDYIKLFRKEYVQRKLKASTQQTYGSRLNKIESSKLGVMILKDIKREHVRAFLREIHKKHPTNANRLHSILSKLFNEALEDGYIEENPIKGMKKMAKENSRDVRYSDNDIKAIWEATQEEGLVFKNLIRMLLITGQRAGETSRMKWSHIENNVWTIPKSETKSNSTHSVPLPSLAVDVLNEMKSINDDSEYVFQSTRGNDKPVTYLRDVNYRLRERTGLKELIIHDLRHIVATGMINLEVDFIHVGKVLNHKGLSGGHIITSRYVNTDLDKQKQKALQKWNDHLKRIIFSERAKIFKLNAS